MNKKIKLYAIAISVIYVCMVLFIFFRGLEPFMASMGRGESSLESRSTQGMESTFHLDVKPQEGLYAFPTPIMNGGETTGGFMEMDNVKVRKFINDDIMPSNYMVFFIVRSLFAFVLFFFFMYAPFLFFKIVRAVTKGNMFDASVLKKMNKIGWGIVIFYSLMQLIRMGEVYFNRQMIHIDNYEIVYTIPNFTPLILGLVILFLAEVLRIGLFMKEEQDLTI